MVFGKTKKKATKKTTKTFIGGKEVIDEQQEQVDLPVPIPPPEEKVEQPLKAEDVYAEGRSVGFQEGLIFSIEMLQDNLRQHQDALRKQLKDKNLEGNQNE